MISNIQFMRAFAAMNVVFFHALGMALAKKMNVTALATFEGWGANGVDVFFVISGFIMAYTVHERQKTARDFITSRLVRVVPFYWLITTITLGLAIAMPRLFADLHLSTEYVISSYAFTSMSVGYQYPLLSVGWTLEYEMLFYILFAAGLLLGRQRGAMLFSSAALAALAMMGALDWIAVEFCMGVGCYLIYRLGSKRNFRHWLLIHISGWILLLLSAIVDFQVHRAIVWGLPATIILLSSLFIAQNSNKTIIMIGDASYSIYLTHLFVLGFWFTFFERFFPIINGDAAVFVTVVVSCFAGVLAWRYIEIPITRWARERLNALNRAAPRPTSIA
ncbi:acyltransferase family protein [Sphingomonas edaphi]|uniref:Acyltransferase n=1 Tax=Sphingomonas edaphi TaxID=2315689 RepID=A0A418PY52_9SPHN|nr:acyltransferase [Sphingomonas edaphi]RIX27014.1 acyltransferase [Sphingomonas edaphi]